MVVPDTNRAQCGIEPQYFNSENQINYAEVSPSCAVAPPPT